MRIALIPIESTSREIESKTYIASELYLNGWIVIVGKKKVILDLSKVLKNCIFLDKGYDSRKSNKLFTNLKKRNHKIISLDEEGAIDAEGIRNLENRYTDDLFNFCSKILFWGVNQRDQFANTEFKKSKSSITGHPRFFKNNYIKSSLKASYILICTNFGWGNNHLGDEWVIQNYKSRIQRINDLIKNDKLKLKILIKILHNLFEMKKKVLLRIHPEEDKQYYQDLFNKHKFNEFIKFDTKRPINESIKKAKFVLHCDSTSGLDAYLQNKKVFSFNNKEILDQSLICQIPYLVSEKFNLEKTLDYNCENYKLKNKDSKIDQWFSNLKSQKDTISSIVDEFNSISKKTKISIYEKSKIILFAFLISFRNSLSTLTNKFLTRKKTIANLKFEGFHNYLNSKLIYKSKKLIRPRVLYNDFGIWI